MDGIKISIILPTRGRPLLARRFLDSLFSNADIPDLIEVVILVDSDDHSTADFVYDNLTCIKVITTRQSMGTYNRLGAERCTGDIIMLANDDVVVETVNWDREIRCTHMSYDDGVYLAYPNDCFKGRALCTFPIISRKTFTAASDLLSYDYKGAFIDYHIMDVFKRLQKFGLSRIVYLGDIIFSHHHYRTGKSDFDQTYADRNRFDDDATFIALAAQRQQLARELKTLTEGIGSTTKPKQTGTIAQNISILLDQELPLLWRIRLSTFLFARSLYQLFYPKRPSS